MKVQDIQTQTLEIAIQQLPQTQSSETLHQAVTRLAIKYNVDETLALKIIYCESSNSPQARHYNKNGTVDYSYWQINSIWKEAMAKKGWDIANPEQNLEAGFYIASTQGIGPWRYSADCQKREGGTPIYR